MIEQEPTRKYYRPTALVQSLSQGYQDYSRLAVISRPYIVDFTAQTNWPAYIATPVGQRMIVRDGTYTLTPMTLNYYYPGFAFPLLESASGRVCLAFFKEEERRRCLDGIVASGETVDMFILNSFRSGGMAADIRARGYANIGRSRATDFTDKTMSVAAPIFSNGSVVAAVSVVIFAKAMRIEEAENLYGPRLASIGQAISEKLSMADSQDTDRD